MRELGDTEQFSFSDLVSTSRSLVLFAGQFVKRFQGEEDCVKTLQIPPKLISDHSSLLSFYTFSINVRNGGQHCSLGVRE